MEHMDEDGYINGIQSAVKFSFFAKFHVHSSAPSKWKIAKLFEAIEQKLKHLNLSYVNGKINFDISKSQA